MTIVVSVVIGNLEVVHTDFSASDNVPLPNVGEFVLNPLTDSPIAVKHRLFIYRQDTILVSLNC